MIEKSIENFMLNGAYYEVLEYKKEGKTPIVETYEKDQWSYIIEIMILTIKSLKPSLKDNGNIIDYKRFRAELGLWKSYRHGMNKNLLYSLNKEPYEGYFSNIDESIYSRVAIITLSNQNFEVVKREIIKNILFSSGNIEFVLECLMLSKILFLLAENKDYEYEDILKELKNEAINFSQSELLSLKDYSNDYKIEFERMRINLISLLNEIDISKFKVLKDCLLVLKRDKEYKIVESSNFFIAGIMGILKGEVVSREIKDMDFLESLCSYIVKLRKGRIDSINLELNEYKLPSIFNYKEGEVFVHPLLNSSQIIYKGNRENFEIAYVKTRTGIYRFINLDRN